MLEYPARIQAGDQEQAAASRGTYTSHPQADNSSIFTTDSLPTSYLLLFRHDTTDLDLSC